MKSRFFQNFSGQFWNSQCYKNSIEELDNYYKILPKFQSMNSKTTPTVIGIDMGAFTAKIGAVQRGAIDVITNQANFR